MSKGEQEVAAAPEVEERFIKGEVTHYDAMWGVATVQLDGKEAFARFFIGCYSSGRPSRPPTVGERVSMEVRHESDGKLTVVQAVRITDK